MTGTSKLSVALLGQAVLRKKAEGVLPQDRMETLSIIQKLKETFHSLGERVGLAAPQVFISKRIFIYRIPPTLHARYQEESAVIVPLTPLINPRIKPLSSEKVIGWEACVSLPGLMGQVSRFKEIECTYETLEGEKMTIQATGFHARVLQHEYDHLDGILFIDRMEGLSTLCLEEVFLKTIQPLEDPLGDYQVV